ncbi:hypothetical protein HBI56_183330 [Parastagonospora nodorum]|nr:hypothetical protein HBH53_212150 [Parastagonospora nodorum]KAH3994257.1 hypothetical protein HBI10_189360 [Parastagonospora nodorum]KAH4013581.1 hypothetical protein HBI13_178190 [Parastagonospora nodorum]KAH4208427.1 hypothetical protein HBI95_090460 [Parastagonospora nodorum]KAH4291721.1 hypothetical protein HBI01_186940 [Parastagonospora nodorum]
MACLCDEGSSQIPRFENVCDAYRFSIRSGPTSRGTIRLIGSGRSGMGATISHSLKFLQLSYTCWSSVAASTAPL